MKTKTKAVLLIVCALVLVVGTMMNTLAYLSADTEVVKNTFTNGKLFDPNDDDDPQQEDITDDFYIFETEYTDDGTGKYTPTGEITQTGNEYTVLPGVDTPKDATIGTNKKVAVDAFVFIEVKDSLKSPLTATISSNWTKMDDATPAHEGCTVYKLASGMLAAGNRLTDTAILDGNKVVVGNDDIPDDPGTIEFYGHIVQATGFTGTTACEDCWAAYVADFS